MLFEVGYYALLLLVLSVVSAAAGKLLAQMFGLPELANSILFMAAVAFVVFFGNSFIEKVISIWSIVFYATYGSHVRAGGVEVRAAAARRARRGAARLGARRCATA